MVGVPSVRQTTHESFVAGDLVVAALAQRRWPHGSHAMRAMLSMQTTQRPQDWRSCASVVSAIAGCVGSCGCLPAFLADGMNKSVSACQRERASCASSSSASVHTAAASIGSSWTVSHSDSAAETASHSECVTAVHSDELSDESRWSATAARSSIRESGIIISSSAASSSSESGSRS